MSSVNIKTTHTLDVRGAKCPVPIVKARKALNDLAAGDVLKVLATDKGSVLDFQGWQKASRDIVLLAQETERDDTGREVYVHYVERKKE